MIVDPNDLINPSKLENLVRPALQQMTEWIMADFDYAYQYIADTQPEQGRYNKDYARVCIMRHCLNEGYYMSGYYQKAIDMYSELKGRYSLFKKGDNPYIEQDVYKRQPYYHWKDVESYYREKLDKYQHI